MKNLKVVPDEPTWSPYQPGIKPAPRCPNCSKPLGQVTTGSPIRAGDWYCTSCTADKGTADFAGNNNYAYFWDSDIQK